MTDSVIQKLDPKSKAHLRTRAKRHGRTIEDEARTILEFALKFPTSSSKSLAERIRDRVVSVGGIDLPVVPRGPVHKPRFPYGLISTGVPIGRIA
jgi:plasmid stability protein